MLAETVYSDLWQLESETSHQVDLKALPCICNHYSAVAVAEKRFLLALTDSASFAPRHLSIFQRKKTTQNVSSQRLARKLIIVRLK